MIRRRAGCAALLIALQVFAGVAVPLAHAAEPETAPATFEAHHDAHCIVLHDALRCTLCQYTASAGTPVAHPGVGAAARVAPHHFAPALTRVARTFFSETAQPRAPPSPLA